MVQIVTFITPFQGLRSNSDGYSHSFGGWDHPSCSDFTAAACEGDTGVIRKGFGVALRRPTGILDVD